MKRGICLILALLLLTATLCACDISNNVGKIKTDKVETGTQTNTEKETEVQANGDDDGKQQISNADNIFDLEIENNPIDEWYDFSIEEGYVATHKIVSDYMGFWRAELLYTTKNNRASYANEEEYLNHKAELEEWENNLLDECRAEQNKVEGEQPKAEVGYKYAKLVKQRVVELKRELYLAETDMGITAGFQSLKWGFKERASNAYLEMIDLYRYTVTESMKGNRVDVEYSYYKGDEWESKYELNRIGNSRLYPWNEGYAIKDLNGDGIDELILLNDSCSIHIIYTYLDGEVTIVAQADEVGCYFIGNDGALYSHRYGSKGENWCYGIKTLMTNGDLMGITFGCKDLQMDGDIDECYKEINGNYEEITYEELIELKNKYTPFSNKVYDWFDMTKANVKYISLLNINNVDKDAVNEKMISMFEEVFCGDRKIIINGELTCMAMCQGYVDYLFNVGVQASYIDFDGDGIVEALVQSVYYDIYILHYDNQNGRIYAKYFPPRAGCIFFANGEYCYFSDSDTERHRITKFHGEEIEVIDLDYTGLVPSTEEPKWIDIRIELPAKG